MSEPTAATQSDEPDMRAGGGGPLLVAPEQVLSTLERDGRRRWIRPRLSPGRFLQARRAVGYVLLALFLVLPHVRVGGLPAMLLDIQARHFTFFGTTFEATETPLLMLFMLSVFFGVFLVTALLGRTWCGWACPQTVYLELVFRPIERLFEGSPQEQRKRDKEGLDLRRALKNVTFLLVAAVLGHTFLAYFVGTERLWAWMHGSPFEHPTAFLVMAGTTAAVFYDFAFFREQTCLVACPYGRFQSVLLDRHSLIVGYDRRRGEPRGKPRKLPVVAAPTPAPTPAAPAAPALGDCIDCGACVQTCPTGIDIRNGLQMECVGCTQCIDACDAIMDRIGRPRGLVRYSSQAELAGEPRRVVRPRVLVYLAIVTLALTGLGLRLHGRAPAEVTELRPQGAPFEVLPSGEVKHQLRFKVKNREPVERRYRLALDAADAGRTLIAPLNPVVVAPGATVEAFVLVLTPAGAFASAPAQTVRLVLDDGEGFRDVAAFPVTGPRNGNGGGAARPAGDGGPGEGAGAKEGAR